MEKIGKSVVFVVVLLCSSCGTNQPLNSISRSNIISVTIEDCASQKLVLSDSLLVGQFWDAISQSKMGRVDDLKLNTGFARVSIQVNSKQELIYLEVVASLEHGPVIVTSTAHGPITVYDDRMICDKCDEFFVNLKKSYPDFNWCQAPQVH